MLEKSHGLYNESVRRVDEEQLLRNIVRMRYSESPLDLRVSSIAAQYELDGSAEARPFFVAPNPSNSNIVFRTFTSILPDLIVSGANRPTITLVPGDNGESVQRFLTPISPETLTFLFQTSWPVATVSRLWVERINGVPNAASASGPPQREVPDYARFLRIAQLFQAAREQKLATIHPEDREIEVSGRFPAASVDAAAVVEAAKNGFECRQRDNGKSWALVKKERRLLIEIVPAAVDQPVIAELAALLNLRPGLLRYDLVPAQGIVPDPMLFPSPLRREISLSTRSSAQVWYFLANGVEVPPEHQAAGVALTALSPDGRPFDNRAVTEGLFCVHASAGHKPPKTAYLAIRHRGYWYFIDDRDHISKDTFALVLAMSRLDFARQQPSAPFLTLPVGR